MNAETINNEMFLESMLSSSLSRVQPDPNFVQRLHDTLTQPAQLQIEKVKRRVSLLVVSSGLFVGALAVWIIRVSLRKKRNQQS